jgi:hypothetical protein
MQRKSRRRTRLLHLLLVRERHVISVSAARAEFREGCVGGCSVLLCVEPPLAQLLSATARLGSSSVDISVEMKLHFDYIQT